MLINNEWCHCEDKQDEDLSYMIEDECDCGVTYSHWHCRKCGSRRYVKL